MNWNKAAQNCECNLIFLKRKNKIRIQFISLFSYAVFGFKNSSALSLQETCSSEKKVPTLQMQT